MPDEPSDLVSLVRRELETWLVPDDSSKEAKLLRRWEKKRRSLRSSLQSFAVVNGFLFLMWLFLAVAAGGTWFPWFVFPLLGWGMGITLKAIGYRSWVQDNARALRQAREHLGLARPEPGQSSWDALEARCRRAIAEARSAVEARSALVDADTLRARLQDGEQRLLQLLEGARTIDRTLSDVNPGGVGSVDRAIAEVEQRHAEAQDAQTRSALEQKRALLQSRRGKVAALVEERARVETTVEGFLLAAENIRLDVLRLGTAPSERTELEAAVGRLREELDLIEQVQRELADL